MTYYGTRLSDNISRREPEGYLLCLNVPVARTGSQDYLPEEVGQPPGSGFITVFRPEEEVFSPECMASFEGMPVTEDHPEDPEGVTAETCAALQKGHAQNLRRGTGPESDLLIADLLITDPDLIRHILSGKREISCGYNYELCHENGSYIQRKIRGNHIAVVDAGRAGHRVSIKDHQCERSRITMQKNSRKALVSHLIAGFAKDENTTAEEVAAVVEAILNEGPAVQPADLPVTEAPVVEITAPEAEITVPAEGAPAEEAAAAVTGDEDLTAKLDRIIELLTALVPPAADECSAETSEKTEDEEAEEVMEAAVEEAIGEAVEEAMTELLTEAEEEIPAGSEDEDDPEELLITEENTDSSCRSEACDRMVRAAVRAVKPIIAGLPADKKRAAADAALRAIRGSAKAEKKVTYAALKSPRRTADSTDPKALGRKIMAARNANRR